MSESGSDNLDDGNDAIVKNKKMAKNNKTTVDKIVQCEETDSDDIIPPSQITSHKTSRWHREQMKKVGIAKPKGKIINKQHIF